jgi:hypothetical protein
METPTELDHFQILKHPDGSLWELGRGAMGVTYKGWNTTLECPVALKVISPQIIGKPDARRRFLNEARAAAQLQHPNIAAVYHLGETSSGVAYYAMEFCDGVTVHEAVKQVGKLDERSALTIVLQVATALSVAEQNSIVHRDLKPSNLMLIKRTDERLWVKVIDFGLACRYDADVDDTLATIGSGLSGTISFASPEQLQEKELDIRSDFYALGVCLWYMLRGESVFQGPHAVVMTQTLMEEPAYERLVGVTSPTVSLIKSMLAKARDKRPATALALCSRIEACLENLDEILGENIGDKTSPRTPGLSAGHKGEPLIFGRYKLTEVVWQDAVYTVRRGSDTVDNSEVLIHVLSLELCSIPAVIRDLEHHLKKLQAVSHAHLSKVVAFGSQGSEWFSVNTPPVFFTFVQLLKVRSALRPSEAAALLAPVAEVLDFASGGPLGDLTPQLFDLWIVPDQRAEVEMLDLTVTKWPPNRIMVNALGISRMLSPASDVSMSAAQTIVAGQAASSAVERPGAAKHTATLFYQLIGGVLSPRGTFAPISRLSEATNTLLTDVQFGLQIPAQEFLEKIRLSLDKEIDQSERRRVQPGIEHRPSSPVHDSVTRRGFLHWMTVPVGLLIGWLSLNLYRSHNADDPHAWDITLSSFQSIQNDREIMDAITDEITRNLQQRRTFAEQQNLSGDIIRDFEEAIALAERRWRDAKANIVRKQSELTDAWEAFPDSYEDTLNEILNSPRERRNHNYSTLAQAFLERFRELSEGKDREKSQEQFITKLCPQITDTLK